jgi:chromosome segregation ATPase
LHAIEQTVEAGQQQREEVMEAVKDITTETAAVRLSVETLGEQVEEVREDVRDIKDEITEKKDREIKPKQD